MKYENLKPEMVGRKVKLIYIGIDIVFGQKHEFVGILVREYLPFKRFTVHRLDNGNVIDINSDNWEIEFMDRTLQDCVVGDILIDINNTFMQKVLGRLNDLVFISEIAFFDKASRGVYHWKELEESGWKIKGEEPKEEVVELTIDQIAEKFGIDPKNVRVKKEK